MMETLQRVEQETVSSQNLANAIENISEARLDATESPTTIEGRRATLPEKLVGQHATRRVLAREVAAWLGYVDPKHEAGK